MGVFRPFSGGDIPQSSNNTSTYNNGQPNPWKYNIVYSEQIGHFLILFVHYPDCTNYEGKKILVYKDVTLEQLHKNQDSLDPHFFQKLKNPGYPDGKYHSPVARFVPTIEGKNMAYDFCNNQNNKKESRNDGITDCGNGQYVLGC